MRWRPFTILLLGLLAVTACRHGARPRSEHSFDEIAARVDGMSAAEIAAVLGEPDSRQRIFLRDERWIWWNYTFLAGENHPPEVRGQVVHLEITFRTPAGDSRSYSEWQVARPFGVAYRMPGAAQSAAARRGGT